MILNILYDIHYQIEIWNTLQYHPFYWVPEPIEKKHVANMTLQ